MSKNSIVCAYANRSVGGVAGLVKMESYLLRSHCNVHLGIIRDSVREGS